MSEKRVTYDLVIIGGGPGGYVAAIKAAQLGLKTALIEKDKVGGVCLHQGCIPTKALLHSADLYSKFTKSTEYGIIADRLGINYPQFHRRKESVVKRLFQGVQFLLKKNDVNVIKGKGRLTSLHEILIEKNETDLDTITAKNIILATGSTPFIPKEIPHDGKFVFTSDDILLLEEIPKSMIIAGGGAVGVEYAYLFNILGTKVTMIERMDTILPGEDKEISTILRKVFTKRGIETLTDTSLETVEVRQGVRVKIERKNNTLQEKGEIIWRQIVCSLR
ncbi:MAG: FAD-dependent oxidoreductase [Candidatus Jettenia sp. AMX1]|nr:MAG: FAD-dependent oxidoreductase [Candidatus Jettenia sp. AMX1]